MKHPRSQILPVIVSILLACATAASALETDQFTVPPRPLTDLGPALDAHVLAVLRQTADAANARRAEMLRRAESNPFPPFRKFFEDRAAETLTPDYLARRFYESVAQGVLECTIERWTVDLAGKTPQALFDPRCDDSVYGTASQRPITLHFLAPTLCLHGVYLGSDKIGHVFQQGYEYYRVYRAEEQLGHSAADATRAAVELGVGQEHGIYGEAIVGVYSNGDLAANYAGLLVYLNLTRPVTIDGQTHAPVLTVREGRWELTASAASELLKPFITDHLNESLNPCRYARQIRDHIRRSMGERGPRWAAFYGLDCASAGRRTTELGTWFGEDYGHSGFSGVITPGDACFGAAVVGRAD